MLTCFAKTWPWTNIQIKKIKQKVQKTPGTLWVLFLFNGQAGVGIEKERDGNERGVGNMFQRSIANITGHCIFEKKKKKASKSIMVSNEICHTTMTRWWSLQKPKDFILHF